MLNKVITILLLVFALASEVIANEGYKSLENWRKLESDQSTRSVRKILGEPQRIEGGSFTYWYYPNGGKVTFYEGRLYGWDEPEELTSADGNLGSNAGDLIALLFLLGFLALLLVPIIWVLASGRSQGGAKFGWFLVVIVFSWIGLAAFLILTQHQKNRTTPQ